MHYSYPNADSRHCFGTLDVHPRADVRVFFLFSQCRRCKDQPDIHSSTSAYQIMIFPVINRIVCSLHKFKTYIILHNLYFLIEWSVDFYKKIIIYIPCSSFADFVLSFLRSVDSANAKKTVFAKDEFLHFSINTTAMKVKNIWTSFHTLAKFVTCS